MQRPIIKKIVAICPGCKSEQEFKEDRAKAKEGKLIIKCPKRNCGLSWEIEFKQMSGGGGGFINLNRTLGPLPAPADPFGIE